MTSLFWALRRVLVALLTLVAVSILIFGAVRLLPGSYTDLVLGPLASEEARQAAMEQLGLNDSVFVQYLTWIQAAVSGDLGTSFVSGVSISDEFTARMPVTVTIAAFAAVLTVVLGIPLGFFTATRSRAGNAGAIGRIVSALGISIPEFVLGGLVVYVVSTFAVGLRIGQYESLASDPAAFFSSLVLPTLVLSVFCIAVTARTTRDAVMNVLVEPHVTAAVARGEAPWFIVRHHVARNAMIPILTLTATIIASLLGGTVIVETIFDVPGLGSYLVTALGRRDYAIVQAGALLATAVFIVSSAAIDILATAVDPRLRQDKGTSA